jgi:hypothetical protein
MDKQISRYESHPTYVPAIGDHVTIEAIHGYNRDNIVSTHAIPGIVVDARDRSCPVIAIGQLGQVGVYQALAVTLVVRGTRADAAAALREVAEHYDVAPRAAGGAS